MKRRKKILWTSGDVFAIQLKNNKYVIGQVLDQRLTNAARIALFDETVADLQNFDTSNFCKNSNLISLIEVTKEQLDFDVWKIVGNKQVDIPISKYPNEKFRMTNWINSIVQDASIAEDFVNAYYALIPWNDWYDKDYLNKLLIDISKKPKDLMLIKN